MTMPRFKKSRPARIHVGKDLVTRGWQLPIKWKLIARRGFGTDAYAKMTRTVDSYEEADQVSDELIARGWDSVEIRSVEQLTPIKN